MAKINVDWLKNAVKSTLAFGKKNAPSLMTGGGVILGWAAVYIFWKESKKADKAIEKLEEDRKVEGKEPLSKKEKFVLYLQYCWISLLMGLGSTGLTIWAHELDISRLTEMYLLTQFLEDKNEEKDKQIEKLKKEIPDKRAKEIENELLEEKYPKDKIADGYVEDTGKGPTLFIVDVGNVKFRSSITAVQEGIMNFRDELKERRNKLVLKALEEEKSDPFYVNDKLFPKEEEDDHEIYYAESFERLLGLIGVHQKVNLGHLLELRDYGYKDFLSFGQTMRYKDYVDPATDVPTVCFLTFDPFIYPTSTFVDRD